MNMTPVQSSYIKEIGYNAELQTLSVCFSNDKVFDYPDFPPEAHKALMAAPSVGAYFARSVRGKYKGKLRD